MDSGSLLHVQTTKARSEWCLLPMALVPEKALNQRSHMRDSASWFFSTEETPPSYSKFFRPIQNLRAIAQDQQGQSKIGEKLPHGSFSSDCSPPLTAAEIDRCWAKTLERLWSSLNHVAPVETCKVIRTPPAVDVPFHPWVDPIVLWFP